jgi:hypothetical protein
MPALPYDATPPTSPPQDDMATEIPSINPLDRALDDHPSNAPIPEHVQALMDRMSKSRVYLLEETEVTTIPRAQRRLRGDPVSTSTGATDSSVSQR